MGAIDFQVSLSPGRYRGRGDQRQVHGAVPSYEPARSRIIESFKRALLEGPPPDVFGEVIANAITARRMRRLYCVGAFAMSLPVLKAFLVAFEFRRMFVRHFSGLSTDRT